MDHRKQVNAMTEAFPTTQLFIYFALFFMWIEQIFEMFGLS